MKGIRQKTNKQMNKHNIWRLVRNQSQKDMSVKKTCDC